MLSSFDTLLQSNDGVTHAAELAPCSSAGTTGSPDGSCYSTLTSGSTLYTLQQAGKGVAIGTATSYTCPTEYACSSLPSNTYCTYCSGTGERKSCVAAGGQRCTATLGGSTVTLELCSTLSFEDGSATSSCYKTLVLSNARSMYKHTSTSVPSDSAYTCPSGGWWTDAYAGQQVAAAGLLRVLPLLAHPWLPCLDCPRSGVEGISKAANHLWLASLRASLACCMLLNASQPAGPPCCQPASPPAHRPPARHPASLCTSLCACLLACVPAHLPDSLYTCRPRTFLPCFLPACMPTFVLLAFVPGHLPEHLACGCLREYPLVRLQHAPACQTSSAFIATQTVTASLASPVAVAQHACRPGR